ncbi:MAG TPA: 4Fe-4S binding protein [bacterium]|nr:4Fe-4S binding protein [bacterium]
MMEFLRRITQIFGFVISHAYLRIVATKQIYQGPLKATCIPFVTCHACPAAVFSCPLGTIQHYMVIRQIPYVLLGHLGILLVAVGRMACGWLCPVGLFQDLMYKIKSEKIKIPHRLDYFKYATLLGLVILIPYLHGEAWFCKLCPPGTLEAAIPWILWNPINLEFQQPTVDIATIGLLFFIKIAILVVFVVFIVISKRPFCRVLCPLGLIFSIFNRFSLIRMKVENASKCSDKCNLCLKDCPMEIKIYEDPNSSECIRCLKCTKCKKVKVGIGNLNESVLPAKRLPRTVPGVMSGRQETP